MEMNYRYLRKNNIINSLFGTYKVKKTGKIAFDNEDETGNNMVDYIYRHLGLYSKVKKNSRAIDALTRPGEYIRERNDAIIGEVTRLTAIFNEEYTNAMNRGYSQERATKLALEEVDYQKKKGLLAIDEEYPTEINNKIFPGQGTNLKN